MTRRDPRVHAFLLCLCAAALAAGCSGSGAKASPAGDAGAPAARFKITSAKSFDVCPFVGRAAAPPGVYGSDLGLTFEDVPPEPGGESERLRILFGDTWENTESPCTFPTPKKDDLQATLPRTRPPQFVAGPPEGVECPPVVPLPRVDSGFSAMRLVNPDGTELSMGFGRTPLTGFSDGTHVFGIFTRAQTVRCDLNGDCPFRMDCTSDPGFGATVPGTCEPPLGLVDGDSVGLCLETADCGKARTCEPTTRGFCVSQDPFFVPGPDGEPVSPPWYRDDPRTGLAVYNYVAVNDPASPDVYTVAARTVSHKFVNLTSRTVRHFDPEDPSKNDYRPGHHTLLVWGRPDFSPRRGKQAPMFFFYQPLEGFAKGDGTVAWAPHFFAGYGDSGKVKWTEDEYDAVPLHGLDVTVTRGADGKLAFDWHSPEFDIVQQFSLSFVEPLGEWVMAYGGSIPAWFRFDAASNAELPIVNAQPHPGAIHYREAAHPWGKASRDAPDSEAWSEPRPLGTPEELAAELGCGDTEPTLLGCREDRDPHRPLQLTLALAEHTNVTEADAPVLIQQCLDGTAGASLAYNLSGDTRGNLYAPSIIDSWTDDVTDRTADLGPGERAVEIYWNVSTWNPYQVVLAKTALRAKRR